MKGNMVSPTRDGCVIAELLSLDSEWFGIELIGWFGWGRRRPFVRMNSHECNERFRTTPESSQSPGFFCCDGCELFPFPNALISGDTSSLAKARQATWTLQDEGRTIGMFVMLRQVKDSLSIERKAFAPSHQACENCRTKKMRCTG
jgi:hypothetical protein